MHDKAARMIDSAQSQHRACLMRWLSLMNAHAHAMPFSGALLGAQQGIRARFEAKFGRFVPASEPVSSIDRD